jgi:hypothetical protein
VDQVGFRFRRLDVSGRGPGVGEISRVEQIEVVLDFMLLG